MTSLTLIVPCKGTDCNEEAITRYTKGLPCEVLVIRNMPYGVAIKEGIRQAHTDLIATMDADGQHTAKDLLHLWDVWRMQKPLDMLIGQRQERSPGIRTIGSAFLNLAASIMAGEHIPDMGSGLRIFCRDLEEDMLLGLPDGFDFNAALTLSCILRGYIVKWTDTPSRPRLHGKSHLRWGDGLKTLKTVYHVTNRQSNH